MEQVLTQQTEQGEVITGSSREMVPDHQLHGTHPGEMGAVFLPLESGQAMKKAPWALASGISQENAPTRSKGHTRQHTASHELFPLAVGHTSPTDREKCGT